jgi:hypothetical protein
MHYFVASLLVTSFLIAVASSQAQTTESWRDLDDFLKSGLSYDSSGNVVPRNVAGQGQWRVRLQDVVSETNVAVFELEGSTGDGLYASELKIQCHDGEEGYVIVSTGKVLENLPYGTLDGLVPEYERLVKIKFDTKEPQMEQWETGPAGDVFGTKKYLSEILKARVFYFQFQPHFENPVTLVFPVAGLEAYRVELKEACGVN